MKKQVISLIMLAAASGASAATTSFLGHFGSDNDVLLTAFDVEAESEVRFEAFAYAGGTMADGTIVTDGGFDNQLHLFDASMNHIQSNDDGSARVSSSSGQSWDAMFSTILGAGSYIVALTQYNNNWTGTGWSGVASYLQGFRDDGGNQRTSAYAFEISGLDISNVESELVNEVPVPAAVWLFGSALLGLAGIKRKNSV
jgi:hypothetical protein